MAIIKDGERIGIVEDWQRLAPPKSADQWADGRSAKEAARAWLQRGGIDLPDDVDKLLEEHAAFGPVIRWEAEPEARLRFDTFRGEPRNSDLAVHAEDSHGSYLIAVEAKADEPFGESVADALSNALERYVGNSASNGVMRIQQLARALFAERERGQPALKELRYQLLTACAGALCEAERNGYQRSLMLVHEFVTEKTTDEAHERNSRDLGRFIERISGGQTRSIRSGEILGPFRVPGTPLLSGHIQLYMGKLTRNLRT